MSLLHKLLPLTLIYLITSGCATIQGPTEEKDPLERFNRTVYEFNDGFDRLLLKPVAEGYEAAIPAPVNNRISNIFSHIDDVIVIINDILQLKFEQTISDIGRFTFNSTFGLFGLFDVASHMELPKHNEDFGQTLGHWGLGSGPYLVLPILGPSTLRDGSGLLVDWQLDPIAHIEGTPERWGTITLEAVDTRAGLLRASRILDTAALDRYVFLRDAYLQRRNNLIYDGNPPTDEMDDFDPFAEDDFDPEAGDSTPAE
ncbi:MAG: VacJ family lipoprotein [Pseudomonadota bacterium]